jgi:hypothetical protein
VCQRRETKSLRKNPRNDEKIGERDRVELDATKALGNDLSV